MKTIAALEGCVIPTVLLQPCYNTTEAAGVSCLCPPGSGKCPRRLIAVCLPGFSR